MPAVHVLASLPGSWGSSECGQLPVERLWPQRARLARREETRALDLTGLLDFLVQLEGENPEVAQFAQQLLNGGGVVRVFTDPESTGAGLLGIQCGEWLVTFRTEHGVTQWPRVCPPSSHGRARNCCRPLGLAIFAWARAHAVPFRLEDPEDLNHDLATLGRAALNWLNDGHGPVLERVHSAWLVYWFIPARLSGAALQKTLERNVRAMNAAAVADAVR